jgi:hypothetical protein
MSFSRSLDGASNDKHRCVPRFFLQTVDDVVASQREGRPIFRERELVQISVPGDQFSSPTERVNDVHKQRWPAEYKAFKEGLEPAVDGFPLEQWPMLKKPQVLELKALGIHTVEQCAVLDDRVLQRLRVGGMRLREMAKAYLDDTFAQTELNKRMAENEALHSRCANSEAKVEELAALVNSLHSQLQALRDQPSELQRYVPADLDPIERMKRNAPRDEGEPSSLDGLAVMKRRGRPTNAEIAAREAPHGASGA